MRNKRCPRCGRWYSVQNYDTDYVHQCRNPDGTRKTSLKEEWHQGTRVTLKVDEKDQFPGQFGMNPKMPYKRISQTKLEKQMKERLNVDTYIEV